jgi:thiol-disulfide isomerase/thioredoxin
MVQEIHVDGFQALQNCLKEHDGKIIFVLFSGSKSSDGKSWCPDCVSAEPVIHSQLEKAPADSIFIHCSVGDRPAWKDEKNSFRTEYKITCVPTLMKWNEKEKRLDDTQCKNPELVAMLFED